MKAMQDGRLATDHADGASSARDIAAKTDINSLTQALRLYKVDNGTYPSTEQGLQALATRPTVGTVPRSWRPYLDRIPLDPWKRAYQYSLSREGVISVTSLGPTGTGAAAPVAERWQAASRSSERKGMDKVIFHMGEKGDTPGKTIAVVFERGGFATWKMTELRLPMEK
jgi:type II secretion system protein G